jgi:ParB family transcriptional regulator, chromosome partitioning protein
MPRAKKAAPAVAPEEITAPASPRVAPMAIQPVPLGRLVRAPENVRHTNKAADVESLADDIAAHGLLQSLIGYAGDTDIDAAAIYIIGGGRRLQALQLLRERGSIDDSYEVSVLIRDQAEAIELSLSENLARRDMNPADEFAAFQELMRPGTLSPADIAKRFGFSERYVKQRLRLGALAPEILNAMREGKLTIDAAMAYAESQDHKLQVRVFAVEAKKSYEPHKPWNIRFAYQSAQMTTSDALFKLVGEKRYEEQGGRYEDDLFGDAERYGNRKVIDSAIVLSIARTVADYQKKRLLGQAQKKAATTSDLLIPPAIRRGALPKAPKGFKIVDKGYRYNLPSYDDLRKSAADQGIDIVAIASVGGDGEFSIEDRFFVPADRLTDVIPPEGAGRVEKTAEEIAAERKVGQLRSVAAFLAAKKIRDEKVEGRQFWRTGRPDLWRASAVDGIGKCYPVIIDVMVTSEEIDAQLEAAEAEYDRQEAEKIARREAEEKAAAEAAQALETRRSEVLAMDPAPVIIQIDGIAHFRWESGGYADEQEDTPAAEECSFYDDLEELLEHAETIGLTWPSLEAWAENPHGDNSAEMDEAA